LRESCTHPLYFLLLNKQTDFLPLFVQEENRQAVASLRWGAFLFVDDHGEALSLRVRELLDF
jgi:hypothetical protein